MDINNNLDLLNSILAKERYGIYERYRIIEIAKASQNMEDLIENIQWELY